MGFNLNGISKFVKIANGISNPKQAISMAMEKLKNTNPQMATAIQSAMKSGKNPSAFLREQAKNGTITKDNLQTFKQYYGMAQKFGLTQKIPSSTWTELENSFNGETVANANNNSGGFSGF
jgi:hypothetical protein